MSANCNHIVRDELRERSSSLKFNWIKLENSFFFVTRILNMANFKSIQFFFLVCCYINSEHKLYTHLKSSRLFLLKMSDLNYNHSYFFFHQAHSAC